MSEASSSSRSAFYGSENGESEDQEQNEHLDEEFGDEYEHDEDETDSEEDCEDIEDSEDEGIKMLKNFGRTPDRRMRGTDLRNSTTPPKKKRRLAPTEADDEEVDLKDDDGISECLAKFAGSTSEHVKRFGTNCKCERCKFRRRKCELSLLCRYTEPDGSQGCWLEETCNPEHLWGFGCKLCRWSQQRVQLKLGDRQRPTH